MKSWKTSFGGIVSLIGAGIVATWPEYTKLGLFLSSVGTGVGLLFARDNNVSSEEAGAAMKTP